MKNFKRENLLFSLCGLNCGLCPMNINQYCSACGGREGTQSCSIAKCSLQHGKVEYCFQCENYSCEKYDNIDEFDSFITHQHQTQDMEKFRGLGIELYSAEQQRKKVLLNHLLSTYNDGRKKTLFCVAVNLLEIDDLENIINELNKNTLNLPLKEKAAMPPVYSKKLLPTKILLKTAQEKIICHTLESLSDIRIFLWYSGLPLLRKGVDDICHR